MGPWGAGLRQPATEKREESGLWKHCPSSGLLARGWEVKGREMKMGKDRQVGYCTEF